MRVATGGGDKGKGVGRMDTTATTGSALGVHERFTGNVFEMSNRTNTGALLRESPLPDETIQALHQARYMSLQATPVTPEAHKLVHLLVAHITAWESSNAVRKNQRRGKQKALVDAVAAIAGDLALVADRRRGRMVCRSKRAGSFSRLMVSYRTFSVVMEALHSLGYLNMFRGYAEKMFENARRGRATRWQPTAAMETLLDECGIHQGQAAHHFSVPPPNDLVVLRALAKRDGRSKEDGKKITYLPHPKAQAAAADVAELNEFATQARVSGAQHQGFYRVFNGGDHPAFDWNMGGRLVSQGSPNYQNIRREERPSLLIDGKPVVEIDISACHLTLIYGQSGAAFDPAHDPYNVPGIPRHVAKAWLVITLGLNRFPKRWTKEQRGELEKKEPGITRQFPVSKVQAAMLAKHPVLDSWPNNEERYFQLMFQESEIILATMLRLKREHNVMSLPVHDSVLVPEDQHDLAWSVLVEEFQRLAGASPRLTTKPSAPR
jgi:hypothetical protein